MSELYRYLNMAGNAPLLSEDKEKRLFFELKRGRESARNEITEANLRLVVSIAKRNCSSRELMDAIQEGNLGLIEAVKRFRVEKGYRFSTYATWWIRQSVLTYVKGQTRMIRLPEQVMYLYEKIIDAASFLEGELERRPTPEEIADELTVRQATKRLRKELGHPPTELELISGMSEKDVYIKPKKVTQMLLDCREATSLDDLIPTPFDGDIPLVEAISDPGERVDVGTVKRLWDDACLEQITAFLSGDTVPARHRDIIEGRFGLNGYEPQTLEEIGKIYGVTRERIRQMETKTLHKVNRHLAHMIADGRAGSS